MIPFSGAFEGKVADMDVDARRAYLEENKVTSALEKIIVQGYKSLQLMYFFTAGHDEVKAWTIQVSSYFNPYFFYMYVIYIPFAERNQGSSSCRSYSH